MFWWKMNDNKKRSEKPKIGFVIIFLVLLNWRRDVCVKNMMELRVYIPKFLVLTI